MKNILFICIQIILICSLKAQVGIGTETPNSSTVFDVVADNKGVILPKVALESRTDNQTVPDLVDGIMVYNTSTLSGNENTSLAPGIYYWLTDRWVPNRKGETVQVTTNGELRTYLGYDPNGVHSSNTFSSGGINFTGYGCKQWSGNGHWYCGFRGQTAFNWQTAFNAAKSRGGYLVTFTTLDEWNWVRTNIIANNTGYNLINSIWIGYNKVNFSGNTTEFTWITGEKSKVNWSNNTSSEHFFNTGEPNNTDGKEGCVHIIRSGDNSERRWNDIDCTFSNGSGQWATPYQDLIIEFHQ
jgi:hypothetical protein